MKKTPYTPGPWILDKSKRHIYGINRKRTEAEGKNIYKHIATVSTAYTSTAYRTDSVTKVTEATANARILASGMDLLNIAKVCIMKLNKVGKHWCQGWACRECINSEITEELVCAILRAEGKEKEDVSMESTLTYIQEWIEEYAQGRKK